MNQLWFNALFVVGALGVPLLAMELIDRWRERRRSPMRDLDEMRRALRGPRSLP